MAVIHGHNTVLGLCATYNGTYVAAAGLDTLSLNSEFNLLEVTAFKDSNIKKRITGLKDWTLDASGHFEIDATSQGLVRSLTLGGTNELWFEALLDGTNGYGAKAQSAGGIVANWKVDSQVGDTVKFSLQLMCNGGMITEVGTAD